MINKARQSQPVAKTWRMEWCFSFIMRKNRRYIRCDTCRTFPG